MGGGSSKAAAPVSSSGPAGAAAAPAKKGCCSCVTPADPSDPSRWGMLPDNKRKCGNCFCLILFMLFWIGMIVIGAIGLKFGKWQRLMYGTDYNGDVCGSEVSGKKYTVYPRTNEDFIANLGKAPTDYKFYGVCTSKCPGKYDVVCKYDSNTGLPLEQVPMKDARECVSGMSPSSKVVTPVGSSTAVTCSDMKRNCWIMPELTSSIMFRCIPVYNVTQNTESGCAYPENVKEAYDPRCITVRDVKMGVTERPAKPNVLFDQLNTARQLWGRWFGDLARSWWVILVCSIAFALVLAFVWVNLLKYLTGCMVWTTIILTVLLLACLTGFFYYKAGLVDKVVPPSWNDKIAAVTAATPALSQVASSASALVPQEYSAATTSKENYAAIAYASTAVLIIVLAIVIAMRAQIKKAVEVIKLGTDALRSLPALLVFPVTNVIAIGVFMIWWVFVAACLMSAGEVSTSDLSSAVASNLATYSQDFGVTLTANMTNGALAQAANSTFASIKDMPVMNYLVIYHIFGLLWTIQFIQGVAVVTVAGTVAGWYFARMDAKHAEDEELAKLKYAQPRLPIITSLWRTLRFHLGSVAFGSLLIAFIQAIRIVAAYVAHKMEPAAKNNQWLKFVLCCVQCCLKLLQMMVECITRNAYIFIALKGDGFLRAGRRVFGLIISHGGVFSIVNVLGEVIMFLGKIFISAASAFAAYVLLENVPAFKPGGVDELSSSWLPILVTLFFAYAVASGFMMIFDISVDTVLVCYCTDIDENIERHTGDKAFAFPIHADPDCLNVQKKLEAKAADAAAKKEASKAGGAAAGPSVAAAPKP